ncbi:MAG TPA: hypothetical protein ENK18_28210 [Deltaproteobacteria bacterium]|nr:hypothetical protein [Deltaproteobacteria bacterium]
MTRTGQDWISDASLLSVLDPNLRGPWREFCEQCVRWHDGTQRNLAQAGEFFTSEALDPIAPRIRALPGLLTAIGILGTFIGITLGLSQVDVVNLEESIQPLITSLYLSFGTSIAGLILSMFSTWRLTGADGRLEHARQRLVAFIDNKVRRANPVEAILSLGEHAQASSAHLVELMGLQERQLTELRTLSDDITTAFEQAIFGRSDRPGLMQVVQGMSDRVATAQAEGMGQLVDHFLDQLNGSLGDQFQELGGSIANMVEANQGYQASMSGLLERFEASSHHQLQVVEQLQAAAEQVGSSMGQFHQTATHLNQTVETMQRASVAIGETLAQHGSVLDAQRHMASDVLQGLEAQSHGWAEHQRALLETYGAIQERFDSLSAAVSGLIQWHDQVKEALQGQVEAWRGAIDEQRGLTSDLAAERSQVDELLSSIREAHEVFEPTTVQLTQAAAALESTLVQIDSASSSVEGLSSQLLSRTRELEASERAAREQWGEVRGEMERTTGELTRGMRQYSEGVNQQVTATLQGFEKELSSAIAALGWAVGALQQTLEELDDIVAEIGAP